MICEKHNTPMVNGKSYEVLAMPAGTPCPFCERDALLAALEWIKAHARNADVDADWRCKEIGYKADDALRGTERTADQPTAERGET